MKSLRPSNPAPRTFSFIEDFDPAFKAEGEIISLDPRVSFHLTQRGVPYRILEEFYSEENLRKDERQYFYDQLEWIERFDRFIQSHVPFARAYALRPARIYYNRVKFFLDAVIIQAKMAREVLENIPKPAEITYIKQERAENDEERTMEGFRYDAKSSFLSELFGLFRLKFPTVHFHLLTLGGKAGTPSARARVERKSSGFGGIKPFLKGFQIALQYRPKNYSAEERPAVLFLHSGSPHLDPVIREFVKDGAHVFVRAGENIYDLTRAGQFVRLGRFGKGTGEQEEFRRQCDEAAVQFQKEGRELLQWVNEKCGVDVSSLMTPYLIHFIMNSCTEILSDVEWFRRFFNKEKIRYVVSHTSSDQISKAAVLASALCEGTKTVGIQHGCQAFEDETWFVTDLDQFDHYLTADGLSQQVFRNVSRTHPTLSVPEISQSPHYLEGVRRAVVARKDVVTGRRILYLPCKLSVHARHFNWVAYPVLWYFEFEKRLLELFATLPDFQFVYKHAGGHHKRYADESILPWIRGKRFKNIVIDARPTMECLAEVERVIVDRPTTAFFEAAVCGLPVLGLYPSFVEENILPAMKEFFGKSLQSFSTSEDAFRKIEAFLQGDLSEYQHLIPLRDEHPVEGLLAGLENRKGPDERRRYPSGAFTG